MASMSTSPPALLSLTAAVNAATADAMSRQRGTTWSTVESPRISCIRASSRAMWLAISSKSGLTSDPSYRRPICVGRNIDDLPCLNPGSFTPLLWFPPPCILHFCVLEPSTAGPLHRRPVRREKAVHCGGALGPPKSPADDGINLAGNAGCARPDHVKLEVRHVRLQRSPSSSSCINLGRV